MTPAEQFLDVARVYRTYGAGCARARLVFHGWTVDEPAMLEALLAKVRDYVQRTEREKVAPFVTPSYALQEQEKAA